MNKSVMNRITLARGGIEGMLSCIQLYSLQFCLHLWYLGLKTHVVREFYISFISEDNYRGFSIKL